MQKMRWLGPAGLALVVMASSDSSVAQYSFGLFRPIPHRARPARPHRQAAAAPAPAGPPIPDVPAPPLPVPRPSFPADAPPAIKAVTPPLPPKPLPAKPAPAPVKAAETPAPPPLIRPPLVAKPAPAIEQSGAAAGPPPRQPVDDLTCPSRLKDRKVSAEPIDIGPQPDARCTVVEAVRLTSMRLPDGGSIEFPDKPTIACVTADTFTRYIGELLSPLAKGTYGAPVSAVWTGPGLECRSRDHIFGAKLSAHGQGLAVDIAQLKLGDARLIAVGTPKDAADQAFETAARAGGCGYFHTVLGPGSDSYHRTHWHFDLEVRGTKGDAKFCQ